MQSETCNLDYAALEQLQETAALRQAVADLMRRCLAIGASDLHLVAGERPFMRQYQKIVYLNAALLSKELAERLNFALISIEQRTAFERDLDFETGLSLPGKEPGDLIRLRVCLTQQMKGICGVYHLVANKTKTLEELGFENADVLRKLLDNHNGIILVAGPLGGGKSTTLASMVSELNRKRQEHIISIEDPIEVMIPSDNCIVTQRELGTHTQSFSAALKSALREDPDIIVIGEMRDLETIEMALTAAETGHLVIATFHTRDAAATLDRILDVFPPSTQNQIRAMVAGSLRGIICQRLIPAKDGSLVMASELLINSHAVTNIIREGKQVGLEHAMQSGKRFGMQSLEASIQSLLNAGKISPEVAKQNLVEREK